MLQDHCISSTGNHWQWKPSLLSLSTRYYGHKWARIPEWTNNGWVKVTTPRDITVPPIHQKFNGLLQRACLADTFSGWPLNGRWVDDYRCPDSNQHKMLVLRWASVARRWPNVEPASLLWQIRPLALKGRSFLAVAPGGAPVEWGRFLCDCRFSQIKSSPGGVIYTTRRETTTDSRWRSLDKDLSFLTS